MTATGDDVPEGAEVGRTPWQAILAVIAAEAKTAPPQLRRVLLRLAGDALRAEIAYGQERPTRPEAGW